jgi:5-methylcytosine-specific restriction endonuclease McrA
MDVISQLVALRRREHDCTVAILEALLVCHRTRRHVDHGYRNLFVFMVEHLDYSKAAASRRLRAVRCAAKFPVALMWLRERRVSLSALAKAAAVLDRCESADALLALVEGRTEDEVELVIARERPVVRPAERIEPVFVKPVAGPSMFEETGTEPDAGDACVWSSEARSEEGRVRSNESERTIASAPVTPASPEPRAEERVTLKFSITSEQYAAFERARAIVSRKTGRVPTLEECFAEFVGLYLERKAPKVRAQAGSAPDQAESKAEQVEAPSAETSSEDISPTKVDILTSGSGRNQTSIEVANRSSQVEKRSRHIPQATRDHVFHRDGERCTYVGPTGRRCTATTNLQIDHVTPFARGGTHEANNLRLLCAEHNRRWAELLFGARES